MIGPGVDPLVDEVDGGARRGLAGGQRVLDRVHAGVLRQERRVDVHDPVREELEERRREQVHVAGEHGDLRSLLAQPEPKGAVPLLAIFVLVERETRPSPPRPPRLARAPPPLACSRRRRPPAGRASSSAWRFVPSPDASTPIIGPPTLPITRSSPGSGDDRAVADPEVEDPPQLLLVHVAGEPVEDRRPLPGVPVDLAPRAPRERRA